MKKEWVGLPERVPFPADTVELASPGHWCVPLWAKTRSGVGELQTLQVLPCSGTQAGQRSSCSMR